MTDTSERETERTVGQPPIWKRRNTGVLEAYFSFETYEDATEELGHASPFVGDPKKQVWHFRIVLADKEKLCAFFHISLSSLLQE